MVRKKMDNWINGKREKQKQKKSNKQYDKIISYQSDAGRTYMILDFTSEKMEHFLYLEVIIMMGKEAMMESRTTEQKWKPGKRSVTLCHL